MGTRFGLRCVYPPTRHTGLSHPLTNENYYELVGGYTHDTHLFHFSYEGASHKKNIFSIFHMRD